jgi:outer membrane protein assembly factor BamB
VKRKTTRVCLRILATILVAGTGHTPATAAEWTSRFAGSTGVVEPYGFDSPRLLSTASGKLFAWRLVEPLQFGSAIAQLDPVTSLPLWSAITRVDYEDREDSKLIVLDDGSTLLLGEHLIRFTSNGNFVWAVNGNGLVDATTASNGDVLIVANEAASPILRRLSGADGTAQESILLPCSGAAFATAANGASFLACGDRLMQILETPLRIGWSNTGLLGNLAVNPDGSALYEWSTTQIGKRSIVDGSVIWQSLPVAQGIKQVHFDSVGNPVSSGQAIDRWDASTGVNLWHVDEAGAVAVDATGGAVYFAATGSSSHQNGYPIGIAGKIDTASGATLWRSETPVGRHVLFKSIAVIPGGVHIAGIACTPIFYYPCKAMLWNASPGSGALSDPRGLAARTAAVGIALEREAGSGLFIAANEWGVEGPRTRVRRVDANSGAVNTDAIIELPGDYAGTLTRHRMFAANAPGDRIAITHSAESMNVEGDRHDATLMVASTIDGQELWHHALRDAGKLGVISAPIVDVAGNITVGVAEQDVFGVPSPTRRWIRHIAGGTGHVLWEREVETQAYEPPYFTFYSPPNVFGLSDCVMTTDTLVSDTRAGMKCLSNMDGSVRWVSSLMDGMPYVLDAATAVFVSWSTSVIWRKFDLKTGDILWQTTLSDPGISTFSVPGTISDGTGSLYTGGSVRMAPDFPMDVRGALIRLDATNGQIVWVKQLDENPVGPRSRVNPRFVRSGKVYATQQILGQELFGLALTAFSPSNGEPQGSGFLFGWYSEPHLPQLGEQGIYGLTDEGSMLVGGQQAIPGRPSEFVMSNWGEPMPGAPGALDVALSVQRTPIGAMVDHAFVFETHNSGAVDAKQVQSVLNLPEGAIVRDLACTIGSMPCSANTIAATVDGNFAIPAGQTLSISGIASLLPTGATRRFFASAYGLHPFFEADLKDNATTLVIDVVFRHGFEATATP